MPRVTPFLRFDQEAEEAAKRYTAIFPDSAITTVKRYGPAGPGPKGSVMTIAFNLDGQDFVALNGGPHFKINEAVSFVIDCADQEAVDYYWEQLAEGGPPEAQRCGWLKDRFGVSWQIVPRRFHELLDNGDGAQVTRVMKALFEMGKIDIAALEAAYAGQDT